MEMLRPVVVGVVERYNFGDLLLAELMSEELSGAPIAKVFPENGIGMESVNENKYPFLLSCRFSKQVKKIVLVHPGGQTLACGLDSAVRMSFASDLKNTGIEHRRYPYVSPREDIAGGIFQKKLAWGASLFRTWGCSQECEFRARDFRSAQRCGLALS